MLAIVGQCVDGNQRIIIQVSEELFTKDDDFFSSGSSDGGGLKCCIYESCSCNSLNDVLTSNVLINITTDVTLSFIANLLRVDNVSIIGHNNPTVHCRSIGGIHFTYCNNCVIQDITWDGCGTKSTDATTKPGIKFSYSSNVTIQNCHFKHSVGQAVVLSEVSGEVNITQCEFINNTHYRGHGAALYYSPNSVANSASLLFTITNCSFINGHAKSLVYLGKTNSKHIGNVTLHSSTFYYNQGVSIYVVNQNFHLKGKNIFQENTANIGAGFFITDYATVIVGENSNVVFTKNSAKSNGGAIFLRDHSNVLFDQNAKINFINNRAYAGTIYSMTSSNILFKANCVVRFSRNSVKLRGAAIYSDSSHIMFTGNSKVTFSDNLVAYIFGIIYLENSSISFDDNSSTRLSNGRAAIHAIDNTFISFNGNSSTAFINGGFAIYSAKTSIFFKEDSSTTFGSNVYGAICFWGCTFCFKGNSSAVFINNSRGAIYTYDGISFEENSTVSFSNNIAEDRGGAVNTHGAISFKGNSFTTFSDNSANDGGAIYGFNISFEGNSTTIFRNNIAENGGAMYSRRFYPAFVSFKDNSITMFHNNTAIYNGGAIFSRGTHLCFKNFSAVLFENNIADYGGAVFVQAHSSIIFGDNPTVTFNKNKATFDATIYAIYKSKIVAKEDFNVTFDDIPAKWCFNACFPYTGQLDTIKIDSNSLVWCSNQEAFECLSNKCHCNDLKDSLKYNYNPVININITDTVMILSSDIVLNQYLIRNVSIIGVNNLTILCVNGGGLYVRNLLTVRIEGITWIRCGGLMPVIDITGTKYVRIHKCSFQHSLTSVIALSEPEVFPGTIDNIYIYHCNFINNNHLRDHGAIIYFSWKSYRLTLELHNCNFSNNGPAKSIIYLFHKNKAYKFNSMHINKSIFQNNHGMPVYISKHLTLYISSETSFENNIAKNGAGIYLSDNSTVIFIETSNVKFINNSAQCNGAGIFLSNHSSIIFAQGSVVKFNDNKAVNGTIYSKASSHVTFMATCEVTFNGNSATQYGAVIYSVENSHIVFTGNSSVSFTNNVIPFSDTHQQLGGTIFSETFGYISFEGNSTTMFNRNTATFGAAIFSLCNSSIIFKGNSRTIFKGNVAQHCGTLTSASFSRITFNDNAEVTYNANTALRASIFYESSAGAICTFNRSDVAFLGNAFVRFVGNRADRGKAVVFSESNIIIEKYSTLNFDNNTALYSAGGAFICSNSSNITIRGNSNVLFNNSKANQNGGAVYLYNKCKIIVQENSTANFINNIAREDGGAMFSSELSKITFEGSSVANFHSNIAENGGAVCFTNSHVTVNESSMITFYNNEARQNGGIGHIRFWSNVMFEGFTMVISYNNRALYGGGIFVYDQSNVTLSGNLNLSFVSNKAAQDGGAGYLGSDCSFIVEQNALLTFNDNTALHGGAIYVDGKITSLFTGNSTVLFYKNSAMIGGGAVSILNYASLTLKDHTTVNFTDNGAQYGGAVYLDTTSHMVNHSDKDCLSFRSNIAQFKGNEVYQDVADSCNSSCLNNTIFGINNELIDTPPYQLQFYNPAVCIDNDTDSQCSNYYIHNVMLGREVILPACVLDYYNNEINDSTQFLVEDKIHQNYTIVGPTKVLISCDAFRGLSITSYEVLTTSKNYSVNISLNVDHNSDWKQISVNLIVGLSPCHPGFWQYSRSEKCECYDAKSIVFCSSNGSTIKGGYWFGSVDGNPTVTLCPINYCNFTCCETVNGYYHLSPVRDNQCRSHRSGIACGSCTDGYTFSFDSTECVNVDSCSAGQTVLVTLLTIMYWIVMVAMVFILMYYKVGIGYLYGITYYYSILDILLNQNLQASRGLYLTVNIISSFSKLIPQFLGELCLTAGMSGIDQQFVHFMHPLAMITILVAISLLARKSRRISTLISRGIIHVICLLLLLSYTSVVSTSLLLIRSLTFYEIDKVYTYLSPDIEYFQGRHLAYGIVALLCIVSIVIGLPLLLTLEPILNQKFNFIKIKPLLDQFQGCYKDKYRCFAGYYMICRLVIITIVIVNSANDFVVNFIVSVVGGIIALLHLTVKPYYNEILNKFDGAILHLCGLVSALRLSDDFDSPFMITITLVLVILPLVIFIAMVLFLHKDNFKRMIAYFTSEHKSPDSSNDANNNEVSMKEFHIIVDDSKRKNATICDV